MKRIDITNGIMRIDTNTETFDIQKIQNRRFMYNPQTGTLILGIQTQCNDFFYKKGYGISAYRYKVKFQRVCEWLGWKR